MRGWYRWMCAGFPSLKDRIVTGTPLHMGYCPERQRGLTVNQLSKTSVVRVHHTPQLERYISWLDSLSDKEKVGGSNPPRSTNGKMAEWPKARAC